MNKNLLTHLALFTVALIYAGNFSIAKLAMPEYISPYAFTILRVGSGMLVFGLMYLLGRKEKIENKRDYIDLAICAFFGVAFNMSAFFAGLSKTTPINGAVLMLLAPFFIVIFNIIFGGRKSSPRTWIGMLLAFIGAGILVNIMAFSFSSEGAVGDLLIMLNATSYAFYLYYVTRLLKKYNPVTLTAHTFFFGFWMVLPMGWNDLPKIAWSAMPNEAWMATVYVILCVTILTYLLNAWAIQRSSSTTAGSYIYLQPFLATIIAIGLGMDMLTWEKAGSGLLILFGLYLVNRKKRNDVYLPSK